MANIDMLQIIFFALIIGVGCTLVPANASKDLVALLDARPAGVELVLTGRWAPEEVMARADRAVAEDMVFVPFAYVEAAANILTNSAIDPYGKIPEFKFCAVKVERD